MNIERKDKISLREVNVIIYDIHMLCVDVENIFLKDQMKESDEKDFHQRF